MELTSPAFQNNETIPSKYTYDGENVNPPLKISGIPKNTKSLILIIDDPDAPKKTWVHWIVFDITPVTYIVENSIPGIQGINDFDDINYGGPSPPPGITHNYHFKLYALDIWLDLPEGASIKEIEYAMRNHIIASAQLIGLYERE